MMELGSLVTWTKLVWSSCLWYGWFSFTFVFCSCMYLLVDFILNYCISVCVLLFVYLKNTYVRIEIICVISAFKKYICEN